MIQCRENLSFGAKPAAIDVRVQSWAQELDGDVLLEFAIGALGEEHTRHATASDLTDDAECSDTPALEGFLVSFVASLGSQRGCGFERRRAEE
jgi:hypothetical protein